MNATPEPTDPSSPAAAKHSGPAGVLFDQRSRYASLAQAIEVLVPPGGTVLDIGSGEAMLLRQFLPQHQVTCLDPMLAGREAEGAIGAPFEDGVVPAASFDAVVCVDVLEHVPAGARDAFLRRMIAASRLGIVVAAPFADVCAAVEVDERVQQAYRSKHGSDYPWLIEHFTFGLPSFASTESVLRDAGLHTSSVGNGHTPWLDVLLGLHVVLLDCHEHLSLLQRIGDRFRELLAYDHLSPVYRRVVVAARDPAIALPAAPDDCRVRTLAVEAWDRFRSWLDGELGTHVDALVQREVAVRSERASLLGERERLLAEVATAQARYEEQLGSVMELRASRSWRWTAPLRWCADVCGKPVAAARRALLGTAHAAKKVIPHRWQWNAKTAYFTLFAPLLRHTNEYREFQSVRRSVRASRVPPAELPPVPPGTAGRDDVIVFGVIDWAFRTQRPQHLARELAGRGHRVLYLAPNTVIGPVPGFSLERVDAELPIHQVRLHAPTVVSIYGGTPPPSVLGVLADGLRELLRHVGVGTNVALVDHPGWVALARLVPRSRLVYDCMDNHHGFATANATLAADERRLLAEAELVVVSSSELEAAVRRERPDARLVMVRNACDPRHFAAARKRVPTPRPVIGYFGAIAEWFDVALVRAVVAAMQDHDFLLVGADSAGVQHALAGLKNVRFTGEVGYDELPAAIVAMDVLFVPFVIGPLTLATNPVKAYEALAAGKPVVATPMPELMLTELAPFVRIGADAPACIAALRAAVHEALAPSAVGMRTAFAERQTWAVRGAVLCEALAAVPEPRFGVVVVSWNGLALTRRCVQSLLEDPAAPALDVVIVDNASADGTAAWLDEIEREPRVRVIRNPDNRGFAAACNQGLAAVAAAGAEVLVILNNDLVVTPGWARTFAAHLRRDPSIGLIGPLTNNIGNEARIDTAYTDMAGMLCETAACTGGNAGLLFDIPVLAFFCVAMPRDVYLRVGDLDTAFGTGFFEDDDYCQRVRRLGLRIVCAEDVFVHHELSASFGKVDPAEKARLFERNKSYYESKWGPWQAHTYRRERPVRHRRAQ